MRLSLVLFIFIILNKITFADASPFYSNAKIDIEYSEPDTASLLECCVIYKNSEGSEDTSCSKKRGAVYVAAVSRDRIKIIRSIPEEFRLLLKYSTGDVVTPEMKKNGMNSYHRIFITGNTAEDITPLFKTTYSNYSIALFATLILELIVAGIFFLFTKIPMRYLFVIGLLNLITHPVLWLITSNITGYGTPLIILEALVTAFEGYVIFRMLKGSLTLFKSLVLSILMNVISFVIGGGIYLLFA